MNRLARALLATTAVTAISISGASVETALAVPPSAAHGAGHGKADVAKGDVRKVLRDVDRLTRRLDHAVRESRLDGLDQATQDVLLDNVDADKATLSALAAWVAATDDGIDLRQARHDLRAVRAQNYVLAVNVLLHAVRVQEAAADNPEASALVVDAVEKALALTASSSRSDVKEARGCLVDAQDLLDADADADADETGTDDDADATETPLAG